MRLAAYTAKNIKQNNGFYNELAEHVGFYPIICFPAETAREIIWRSIISDPEIPEQLIVFDTDDYQKIDMILWNQRVAHVRKHEIDANTPIPSIQDCFSDKNDVYQMYLVKEIKNPVVAIDIKSAMNFIPETEMSEWRSFIGETIKAAQACAAAICKNVRPGIADETPWTEYNHLDHMIIKEGFQGCLLPLLYPIALDKPISNSTYFDYAKYLRNETTNKIARFFDPEGDVSQKTYEHYNNILRDIRACLMKTYDMQLSDGFNNTNTIIGPNSKCPCGSGKKYKKCCKNSPFDYV